MGRKMLALTVLGALLVTGFPSEILTLQVEATSETKEQLEQAKREKEDLEQQKGQNEENKQQLEEEKSGFQGKLNNLNGQLAEVTDHLMDLESQIQAKVEEIDATTAALEEAIATRQWQYECMCARVRAMYETRDISYYNAVFGAQSLSGLLTAVDYFNRIEAYDQRKLQEFKDNQAYIESEKARLEQEQAELVQLQVEAEADQTKVNSLIGQTKTTITQYSAQITDMEAQIEANEAAIRAKEADIEALKKKYEEELALSRKAANSVWRDISEVTFEEGDRMLLANIIYCEAGNQPYEGQVAVGAVVMNRVLSAVFPNTVSGVIYQKNQFSPVASGRLAWALSIDKATDACYRAADEAMAGNTTVGNCLFFRTPIEGLTGIQIGGHIFY